MTKFSIRTIYKNPKWSGQTAIGLEHLQSFIDLRQRLQQPSHARSGRKSDVKVPSRLVINVGGTRFETFQSTLERYPNTLLGNSRRRALFYDKKNDEYFFDRHRLCFEAILYFYQSAGRLRRPDHVPVDTFLEEITFFDLGAEALAQVRHDEELVEAHKVQLPKNRFCRHLWANLEYPQYSMTAKIIHICSIFVILTSAVELAVETLPKYRGVYDNRCEYDGDGLLVDTNNTAIHRLCRPNFRSSFFIIQSVCIAFFTLEFLLRVISCPSYFDFIKSILNWIDFLAIVPYFISLSINLLGLYSEISLRTYFAMSLLRIFRFLRIVKLYRIFQHIKALRVLASTLKESIPDFIILFSILTLSGFLVGAAIYFVENDLNPQVFDSIPKATYYGIITLTAVGYGDLTPITPWGRAIACFAAIYGISMVSMLVSVLVGRYQRVFNRKRFLNEEYPDEILFNDTYPSIANVDPSTEGQIESDTVPVLLCNDDVLPEEPEIHSQVEKSDVSSSKVRFIIGYMSDDDDEEEDTDRDEDQLDTNGNEMMQKIAQTLIQSKGK